MVDVKEEEHELELDTLISEQDKKEEQLLRDYFQLDVKLVDLYREWSNADQHFNHTGNIFTGNLRM